MEGVRQSVSHQLHGLAGTPLSKRDECLLKLLQLFLGPPLDPLLGWSGLHASEANRTKHISVFPHVPWKRPPPPLSPTMDV